MQERQVILHRSLTQSNLLWGGERLLVILLWTLVLMLITGTGFSLIALCIGMLIGLGGQFGLIKAAQVDPLWFAVYQRSLCYRDWYPAHSHIRAVYRKRHVSVP